MPVWLISIIISILAIIENIVIAIHENGSD